jgi:predicted amidohydrolase
MQSFQVAAVTLNALLGDVAGNLDKIAMWTGRAAAAGAHLVLFPELCVNGHCDPDTERHAEPVPGGPSIRRLEEVASRHGLILALRGAEVLLMPHASRMKMWDDTAGSERAAAECISGFFHRIFPARALENACYCVVVNQAGKAGTVARYAPDHPNQPHHAGGCMALDPLGETIAELPSDAVREQMLVATLDGARLNEVRGWANYTLRTRRPEIYTDLAR